MQKQRDHVRCSKQQFAAAVSSKLAALDIETACADKGSKADMQPKTVHLDTDPASGRSSSNGDSSFSFPSSAGHASPTSTAVISLSAGDHSHAAGSTAAAPEIQPAADIESAVRPHSLQHIHIPTKRSFSWKVINYVIIPLCLPAIALFWVLCLFIAAAVTWTILPSLYLAKQLYWACPFIPYIWNSNSVRGKYGMVGSWLMRLSFEGAHCMTVLGRLLTLPIRPHLPDFYILGFPVRRVCNTLVLQCS